MLGLAEYPRWAGISVAHRYHLSRARVYQRARRTFDKIRGKLSTIGERRPPQPNGQPGDIRVATVHQGALDGVKGLYHSNAVDEVTQFEVVGAVEKLSERYLSPVLRRLTAIPWRRWRVESRSLYTAQGQSLERPPWHPQDNVCKHPD